jgi:AcrR family transcriptional regulator
MEIQETSRRERKKEETRQKIFKVAVKLFRDRGFDETTVDEITEKADVAKGTFFNYFPRKEAVLAYLSQMRLEDTEENVEAILASGKPTREKLTEIFSNAASVYEDDRELSRFVMAEIARRAFTPSEDAHKRWHDLVVRFIEQGKATGDISPGVDAQRAAFVLKGVYISTVFVWTHCPELAFDLSDEIRARMTLVFDGLAANGVAP